MFFWNMTGLTSFEGVSVSRPHLFTVEENGVNRSIAISPFSPKPAVSATQLAWVRTGLRQYANACYDTAVWFVSSLWNHQQAANESDELTPLGNKQLLCLVKTNTLALYQVAIRQVACLPCHFWSYWTVRQGVGHTAKRTDCLPNELIATNAIPFPQKSFVAYDPWPLTHVTNVTHLTPVSHDRYIELVLKIPFDCVFTFWVI